ncbi:hypothetical protein [Pseudobacteriovorax antillogorgiicola]|uniref:Uncharacterized protein n=1 Tax=Pseudobacteriovorax antillogorgiicola TaxID=1513793 RepID=A0A1Y6BNC9_9BACT|nr:hypothetical protein [Pseudobacteriovorax antillogorgiicola]TCS54670.1 hypothetical protein EDD56_106183 [Pseudobacteriovorax antillogorgiicola]SMF16714.1 hypothetical protein SAMN06296036_10660 [Pseudobacteriovorax antillogorgiicola]
MSQSTLQLLNSTLQTMFQAYDIGDFRRQIESTFKLMKLRKNDGKWFKDDLAFLDHCLLRDESDTYRLKKYVEQILKANRKNPFLMGFLKEIEGKNFGTIDRKLAVEGPQVLFEALVYSWILEHMTQVLVDKPDLLSLLHSHWVIERSKVNSLPKGIRLFFKIKLVSVEGPIKRIINFHRTGKVRPSFLRVMLPLNIYEASFTDLVQGKPHNAFAGLILAIFRPGKSLLGFGSEVASWSEDRKRVEISYPGQLAWNDLYQVWNMAFITRYSYYPLIIQKLLQPSLSEHFKNPKYYVYHRTLSLYVHLHFGFFNYLNNEQKGLENWNWLDESFTKSWGKANMKYSLQYFQHVLGLKKGSLSHSEGSKASLDHSVPKKR